MGLEGTYIRAFKGLKKVSGGWWCVGGLQVKTRQGQDKSKTRDKTGLGTWG